MPKKTKPDYRYTVDTATNRIRRVRVYGEGVSLAGQRKLFTMPNQVCAGWGNSVFAHCTFKTKAAALRHIAKHYDKKIKKQEAALERYENQARKTLAREAGKLDLPAYTFVEDYLC